MDMVGWVVCQALSSPGWLVYSQLVVGQEVRTDSTPGSPPDDPQTKVQGSHTNPGISASLVIAASWIGVGSRSFGSYLVIL